MGCLRACIPGPAALFNDSTLHRRWLLAHCHHRGHSPTPPPPPPPPHPPQGRYEDVTGSMARLYVWLRFSAIRQLTWQRNYNTQPRILGSAQERLTHAIADAYARTTGEAQEWARLMLTTVGRGGNAQVGACAWGAFSASARRRRAIEHRRVGWLVHSYVL